MQDIERHALSRGPINSRHYSQHLSDFQRCLNIHADRLPKLRVIAIAEHCALRQYGCDIEEPQALKRKAAQQWRQFFRPILRLSQISDQPGWKAPYDLMPGNPSDRA